MAEANRPARAPTRDRGEGISFCDERLPSTPKPQFSQAARLTAYSVNGRLVVTIFRWESRHG